MARLTLAIDLNRCMNCKACNAACKEQNDVGIGYFWTWVDRKQSDRLEEDNGAPSHDFYYLPMQCQHCDNPECVQVCPTEASHIASDGTVQIDKAKCIGCQFCAMACPYGVRYLNEEERVVEKCTLCEQKIAQGELPQCVSQCGGLARFFGDLDEGIENFDGPLGKKLGEYVQPYEEADIHHLADSGNSPSFVYILRNHTWQD